jgi:cell division protease FtsH
MVTQWGMSDKLGPIRYGAREELVFLGRQYSEHRNYSDKVAQEIDAEIHQIVEEAHQRCRDLLLQHWDKMTLVSDQLMQVETINSAEFEALMRGEQPPGPVGKPPTPKPPVRERVDEGTRADKRNEGGVDLGGTVPAPA